MPATWSSVRWRHGGSSRAAPLREGDEDGAPQAAPQPQRSPRARGGAAGGKGREGAAPPALPSPWGEAEEARSRNPRSFPPLPFCPGGGSSGAMSVPAFIDITEEDQVQLGGGPGITGGSWGSPGGPAPSPSGRCGGGAPGVGGVRGCARSQPALCVCVFVAGRRAARLPEGQGRRDLGGEQRRRAPRRPGADHRGLRRVPEGGWQRLAPRTATGLARRHHRHQFFPISTWAEFRGVLRVLHIDTCTSIGSEAPRYSVAR